LNRVFSAQDTCWCLIGGLAVVAHGVVRTTKDLDATFAGGIDLERLVGAAAAHGLAPRIPNAVAFANANQVLLLRHISGVDVDLSLAWLDFELEALAAAERLALGRVTVPIARPEDLVVYKFVAWRPVDRADMLELLTLHSAVMDLDRVRSWVRVLAKAMEAEDRVDAFEALVRSVGA
jgi:hypothetical protein